MSAGTVELYNAVIRGTEPDASGRRVAFLVSTTDLSLGRGDPYVAAGLGRALSERGVGVRLIPQPEWYRTKYHEGEVAVAMLAAFDIRLMPNSVSTIAWMRNSIEQWAERPYLDSFRAILTSSELSESILNDRFNGPTGVLPIGFDPGLFSPPPRGTSRVRLGVTSANHWGTHRLVHQTLRTLDHRVGIDWYGVDRSQDPRMSRFNRGMASYFDLPDIYRRSIITIDDVNAVGVGWGNHNSRLFEALACGSLVVTNTQLGLAELGLQDVPVYRDAAGLEAILQSARRGEYTQLAEELSGIVLERHSFSHRADKFLEFAEHAALWEPEYRAVRIINYLPNYSPTNSFQGMLYSGLTKGIVAVPSQNPIKHPIARDSGGDLRGHVLHVHWQNVIVQPATNDRDALRRYEDFTTSVRDLKDRGARVVWTIHNALPHELTYYFLELELCRFLADEADVIHALSPETVAAVQELYPLDQSKVVVVPHGSYVGVYPEVLDRAAARARLGILPSERVVLLFGAIRPYKGLSSLIDAFERMYATDPSLRLLVAGSPGRTMDKEFLATLQNKPHIVARLEFIPDAEVHLYFAAADVQVAPYASVLNSGSVLLGLGFGLPVVVPRLGALQSLAGLPFVQTYSPKSANGLERAIRRAVESIVDPAIAARAKEFAAAYGGDDMGRLFFESVVEPLLVDDVESVSPMA
jgi:glycosyltransferase involved in cell wall biosynthesis